MCRLLSLMAQLLWAGAGAGAVFFSAAAAVYFQSLGRYKTGQSLSADVISYKYCRNYQGQPVQMQSGEGLVPQQQQ